MAQNNSRQKARISPIHFNSFLEKIMSDALEDHGGKVNIAGRTITSLRFADDIDAAVEKEQELEALFESLDKTSQDINGDKWWKDLTNHK